MKKHSVTIILLLAIFACSEPEETHLVEKKRLNEAVYASGEIMPARYYFLEVNAADKLMSVLVEEGDSVQEGKVLAVSGTPSENRQLDLLTRQVSLVKESANEQSAVLEEIKSRIKMAQERYLQDSLNAIRYMELAEEKAVSVREAENAVLEKEASRTEYLALRQQYTSRRNELQRNALQVEQQLAQLHQSREGKVLTSPMKGVVYRIFQKEGAMVQAGEPVMLIGDSDKFKLELLVDERDINKVKLGQPVYFETDVYHEKQFEARVSKIIPVLQKENRSFRVEAQVLSSGTFFPQSTVEANIIIRKEAVALLVPVEYVLADDSVKVKQDDKVLTVKVIPGTKVGDWVEIKSGLDPGAVLVKAE